MSCMFKKFLCEINDNDDDDDVFRTGVQFS